MNLKISILTSVILLTSCVKNQQVIIENFRTVPKEAKLCIISNHYTPILHEDKWICGEEYEEINFIRFILSDTTYYDEFNNKLLWVLKNRRAINKYIYLSPEKKILDRIYSMRDWKDGVIDSAVYIRNSENKLIEIVVSGLIFKESVTPVKYFYNNEGFRNGIVRDGVRTIIERSPPKEGLRINTYKKLEKRTDSGDEKEELIEKGIEIFNTKGELIRIMSEYYKYGKLSKEEEVIVTYDEEGREIKQEMKGKSISSILAIPNDIDMKDEEEYIKEKYYKNIEYSPIGHVIEWKYNNQGDLESKLVRNLNSSGLLMIELEHSERYEYVYDSKGRWIEKYSYKMYENKTSRMDQIAGVPDEIEKNYKPHIITIREIIEL